MVFHGKGGYDFDTLYNFPNWLRKFIFNEIKTFYEEEAKQASSSQSNSSKTTLDLSNPSSMPDFLKKKN